MTRRQRQTGRDLTLTESGDLVLLFSSTVHRRGILFQTAAWDSLSSEYERGEGCRMIEIGKKGGAMEILGK